VVKTYTLEDRPLIDHTITERTLEFIERQTKAEKPFFAYVPFTQPHLPTLPHPDFKGRTGKGNYADVLEQIDAYAGRILDKVTELGISENTIVIWTSDNGPEQIEGHLGTAGFWRGNYFTALEGSLRTSFLIRWPGKIPVGRKTSEIVHTTDLMPSYEVPTDRMIDGKDQLDFFLGKKEKSNREGFPVYNGDEMFAYKYRDYKMHFIQLDSMFAAPRKLNMPQMFNLIKAPKELYPLDKVDVADAWFMAPVTKRLIAFQESLAAEPPIRLGTPDPYTPPKK